MMAFGVLVALCAPLVIAWRLEPSVAGVGTHEQLGRPACSMLVVTGYPCPTCGMTTAFAHTVRGDWLAGFLAQPFGWLLAMGLMLGVCLAFHGLVFPGRWQVNWYRIPAHRVAIVLLILFLGSWGYKITTIRLGAG